MKLQAETRHLLEKKVKRALHPLEICGSAVISVFTYALVYQCVCSEARYNAAALAGVGLAAGFAISTTVVTLAVTRYRSHQPSRAWIALAFCVSASFAGAYITGGRYWDRHLASLYTWDDMASYVNIDPFSDKGQSFMDAGAVYFKDGSYVLKSHAIAFRNGRTYCVAPIVRAPSPTERNATKQTLVNGFELPRSGSVDFWAVGIDCCGPKGEFFTCGDATSRIARSGLRALDDMSRPMYVLGIQEWSATTGLPVKHPLFFTWVKDPISHAENLLAESKGVFITGLLHCFGLSLIAAFAIHTFLQRLRVS